MRINRADIDLKIAELNELLDRPAKHYDPESRLYGMGHFHIYKTHFGYELHETTSQSGAVRSINAGGLSARAFYDFLCAYCLGFVFVNRTENPLLARTVPVPRPEIVGERMAVRA